MIILRAAERRRGTGKQFGARIDLRMDFHADDDFPITGRAFEKLFWISDALRNHGVSSRRSA